MRDSPGRAGKWPRAGICGSSSACGLGTSVVLKWTSESRNAAVLTRCQGGREGWSESLGLADADCYM